MAEPLRILAPIGMIGYGIDEASLARGVATKPALIGADGGSVDPGPHYLGSGLSFTSRELVTRDLALCLRAAEACDAPVVVGTAGGAGGAPHVAFALDCLRDAAREAGRAGRLRVALVHAEQPAERVQAWARDGALEPFGHGAPPDEHDIARCERVVAQMGVATVARALEQEPDVVLAGRASDVAIFAGPAVRAGHDWATAIHLAKILECGAHCAEPASGRDGIAAEIAGDRFELEPVSPERRCTPQSVAAHMLYENAHPFLLREPDGTVDLEHVELTAVDARRVRASGARFAPADAFTVKLEGAAHVGFRSLVIGGMRDPRLVAAVDEVLDAARAAVAMALPDLDVQLAFHVYGRDGVLGASEPSPAPGHELGVVCEAIAPTQSLAHAAAQAAEAALITADYRGGISATGNLAVPFSPLVVDVGPAYEWAVFCIACAEDETSLFDVELLTA